MSSCPLIVLKFGGSVLTHESSLRRAVHEVYRWRREGWHVVAVVSAYKGRTEALLKQCGRAAPFAQASMLATGEQESAAILGLLLDRAGIPSEVHSPASIGLRAEGDSLDANPKTIDVDQLNSALHRSGVVVIPGFTAIDREGRTVTLGRGGSDLTALFVAHHLRATKCRLIKDVDGLYEFDPESYPTARRYDHATFDDALSTDGSIVQHKAVQFAKQHGRAFELGRFNGTRPSTIGAAKSSFVATPDLPVRQTVVLLGPGVVGGGVVELIAEMPELFHLEGVSSRATALELSHHGADILIETVGGTTDAKTYVKAAIRAGSTIVTANKALLSEGHIPSDAVLASSAVGGSVPVLEAVKDGDIVRVRGVLNGTCNFVLNRIATGSTPEAALEDARTLGFAEADATRDLDGRDALDKLRLIAAAAGIQVNSEFVSCILPKSGSGTHRQKATLDHAGNLSVTIEAVDRDDPLYIVPEEENAVLIDSCDGTQRVLRGRGAGRWPTAEALMGDLLALARAVDPITARRETPALPPPSSRSQPPESPARAFALR